ncbi:hypothetical protein [Streptomyces sp. NPDC002133]|uniref:MmyB family transcriptional regulator n=1 Tax=Streptomyces sp. NPDC002133 TaxID=3154409 RepID=UPI00332485E0
MTWGFTELRTEPKFEIGITRWESQNVRQHTTGLKRVNHPIAGRMDLAYDNLHLAADPDITILTFSSEPGTAFDDAMRLLNLWARDEARTVRRTT